MNENYKNLKSSVKDMVHEIDPENLVDVALEDEHNDYILAIVSRIINNDFDLKSL